MEQSFELSRDGTVHIYRALHNASGTTRTSVDGRWRIENGEFVLTEDDGGRKTECRFAIVSVSEWEWVMKDSQDSEFRAWRYPK